MGSRRQISRSNGIKRKPFMTLAEYESILAKVEKHWHTYSDSLKWWTKKRMQELLKEIKNDR